MLIQFKFALEKICVKNKNIPGTKTPKSNQMQPNLLKFLIYFFDILKNKIKKKHKLFPKCMT